MKHYLRLFEVNENKALSYGEALRYCGNTIKTMKKMFSIMSNLQAHYHFKLDFQKVDRHTGGKCLTRGPKHRKDNQLESLELPCRIPW